MRAAAAEEVLRLPHESQPRPEGSEYCACHTKASQEALCTAPATRSQPRPSGAHARRSCLPRERHLRSSIYCACHTKASRGPAAPTEEALCTPGGTRKAARRFYVLLLPHESQPRPSGAHARRSSSRRLCVLATPPPGGSVYCTCHAKGSQYCACHTKASRGPPPLTRPPAPPGDSVYLPHLLQEALCTASPHETQPRPSGAHARRSSSRRLCVLRLPRERQPGSSLYCLPATR